MLRNIKTAGMGQGPSTSHVPTLHAQPLGGQPISQPPINQASKVAEVFLTAGHAFQKLGDLTLQLHAGPQDAEESKWSERDVDQLRDALTRFAHELDTISESVQNRTNKHIKVEIKRRTLIPDDVVRRSNSPALGQKRVGAPLVPMTSGLTTKRIATVPAGSFRGYQPTRLQPAGTRLVPSTTPLTTPLLSDPSHHYINTRQPGDY